MEIFGHVITFSLITVIAIIPVRAAKKRPGFLKSLFVSLPICFVLVLATFYWDDLYKDLRLEMMGVEFDGMNDSERFKNVPFEIRTQASELYSSRFGIGWPLKAMFGMVFFVIPYILLVLGSAAAIRYFYKKHETQP